MDKNRRKGKLSQKRPTASAPSFHPERPSMSQADEIQRPNPRSLELNPSRESSEPPTRQHSPDKLRNGENPAAKPKRHYRPGQLALKEIRKDRSSTQLLLQTAPLALESPIPNSRMDTNRRKGKLSQKRPTASAPSFHPKRPSTSQAHEIQRPNPRSLELNPSRESSEPPTRQHSPDKLRNGENPAAKPKRRYRPGQLALKEIRKYQRSTQLLIRRTPFARLVRDICMEYSRGVPYNWQNNAIMALQESAEAYIVQLFEDSYASSLTCKRVTLQVKDMKLVKKILCIRETSK